MQHMLRRRSLQTRITWTYVLVTVLSLLLLQILVVATLFALLFNTGQINQRVQQTAT